MEGNGEGLVDKVRGLINNRQPFAKKDGDLSVKGKYWDYRLRAHKFSEQNLEVIYLGLAKIADEYDRKAEQRAEERAAKKRGHW